MQDYTLVGCGHCGVGVLRGDRPLCPFQPHSLCAACFETMTSFIATLQAQGHDPLSKRERRRREKQLPLL